MATKQKYHNLVFNLLLIGYSAFLKESRTRKESSNFSSVHAIHADTMIEKGEANKATQILYYNDSFDQIHLHIPFSASALGSNNAFNLRTSPPGCLLLHSPPKSSSKKSVAVRTPVHLNLPLSLSPLLSLSNTPRKTKRFPFGFKFLGRTEMLCWVRS